MITSIYVKIIKKDNDKSESRILGFGNGGLESIRSSFPGNSYTVLAKYVKKKKDTTLNDWRTNKSRQKWDMKLHLELTAEQLSTKKHWNLPKKILYI